MKKLIFRIFIITILLTSVWLVNSIPKAEAADCSASAMDAKVQPWMEKETARGTAKDGGFFRHYESNASIYCHSTTGVFEVHGLIRQKYSQLNWEWSFLGYPMTDELATPDGKGRFNHFQGGSIYWHPNTGAYEVHGLIREQWKSVGWEKSFLGYPISDELVDPNNPGGRYSNFQGGVICWNPSDGTKVVQKGKGPDSCKKSELAPTTAPTTTTNVKESKKPSLAPNTTPTTATNVKEPDKKPELKSSTKVLAEKTKKATDSLKSLETSDVKETTSKIKEAASKRKSEETTREKKSVNSDDIIIYSVIRDVVVPSNNGVTGHVSCKPRDYLLGGGFTREGGTGFADALIVYSNGPVAKDDGSLIWPQRWIFSAVDEASGTHNIRITILCLDVTP